MALDFSSLQGAVSRLEEGLARYLSDESDEQIRDGLIQRFEFTYDLSHKFLRRVMEAASADPQLIDRMTFSDLIRTAYEQGMVAGDWPTWRTWREMRNITSHTYDRVKAVQVVEVIPLFLIEAKELVARLMGAQSD